MSWLRRNRDVHSEELAVDLDRQRLILLGTQLVHWEIDGDDLVLDLWGGRGSWLGYRDGDVAATGQVTGSPAFTIRAHLSRLLDLELLERLERMSATSGHLSVRIDADGAAPLEHPVSLELSDGIDRLRVDALA